MARVSGKQETPQVVSSHARPTFDEFFEAEKDRLLRVLSVITGSLAEGEDLAQEAFTYLHRTAMNLFRRPIPARRPRAQARGLARSGG